MFVEIAFKVVLIIGYAGLVFVEANHIQKDVPSARQEREGDENDKNP